MKKIQVLIILLFLALNVPGCANTGKIKAIGCDGGLSEERALNSMLTKPRFHVRKRFTYLIAWNSIPVGRIIAESADMMSYQGHDVYVVKVVTESNKFLSRIYRVEDIYISYIDAQTMTSLRYEADRKEGNYRKHVIVEYDPGRQEAIYANLTDGSVKRCSIENNVQDPLSAMCYFITLPLRSSDKISITVNLNEKNYCLFGKVEGVKVVKLPRLGSFPAFRVRPYVELGGRRLRKGRGWMYFSADKRRYPLYGVVLIPFGRVTATLRKVEDI